MIKNVFLSKSGENWLKEKRWVIVKKQAIKDKFSNIFSILVILGAHLMLKIIEKKIKIRIKISMVCFDFRSTRLKKINSDNLIIFINSLYDKK